MNHGPPPAVAWRTSSASNYADCVEAARVRDEVWIRNSKRPDGTQLSVPRSVGELFLDAARQGALDQ